MTARRLAHPPPPAPAKAIHATEIATASEAFGRDSEGALYDLLTSLFFPHSEWWLGRGSAVNTTTHQVTATLNGGAGTTGQPAAAYAAGTGATPTRAQLTNKRLVCVVAVLLDQPLKVQRFIDWTLDSDVTASTPQPPPTAEPAPPPAITIRGETYQQYVLQEANHFTEVWRWALRRECRRRFLKTVTRFQWGHAIGIDTTAKTVTVQWDSADDAVGPPSSTVAWGTRRWSRAQIVGKRVRVAHSLHGTWVDDIDQASGRI